MSFEEDLTRLERIAGQLEREELPLADALALFEEGIQRLRSAHEALQQAEGTVRTLVEQAGGLLEVRDGLGG